MKEVVFKLALEQVDIGGGHPSAYHSTSFLMEEGVTKLEVVIGKNKVGQVQ